MRLKLPEKAVAINRLTDRRITIPECIEAFKKGFEDSLDIELVPYELTENQKKYVKDLEENKYKTDEWNYRK